MIRPQQTLAFLLALGVLGFGLMSLAGEEGFRIGSAVVRYPNWESFTRKDTTQKVNMEAILRAGHLSALDSTRKAEEAAAAEQEALKKEQERIQRMLAARKLQFAEKSDRLKHFQSALQQLASGGKLRILHFGDSQIEGDRISSLLRQRWQEQYGGYGPGMQAAVPLAPNFSIRQTYSPQWKRYAYYGRKDTNIRHDRFGYMAVIGRYSSPIADSLLSDSSTAWLRFESAKSAYGRARNFSKLLLYLGGHSRPVNLQLMVNDSLHEQRLLPPADSIIRLKWNLPQVTQSCQLNFQGPHSPDVYGISLEGQGGIVLDNIPMRGASGLVFSKLEASTTRAMLQAEPVHLVLLQYGGNTVPYIKDEAHAEQYARQLRRQIQLLKKWLPKASFVLIGPSDMSTKKGTDFVTYDAVPWVRNALRTMALEEGIGFWDIYGAMGGRNAMPAWVNAKPPLAGADHIHFTPQGAKQVAEWLYQAFEEELHSTPPAKDPAS